MYFENGHICIYVSFFPPVFIGLKTFRQFLLEHRVYASPEKSVINFNFTMKKHYA